MNNDHIQKYILKNQNNLRIAATTSESWLAARNELVQRFQEGLKTCLCKKLKGWEFGAYDGIFFETVYAGYYFWKTSWADQYNLGLQMCYNGEQAILGVGREYNYIKRRPFSDELLDSFMTIHPSADRNVWWEAKAKLQYPAADWREPAVLWKIYKDKKFTEEVAEQLLEMAEVTAPIVDGLVRKYKK